MGDKTEHSEVPTYYSNFVTMQLNTDEMVMEFRSHRPEHNRTAKGGEEILEIPPAEPGEVLSVDPVARVVVTFTSAAAMKQFLDQAFPTALERRKK